MTCINIHLYFNTIINNIPIYFILVTKMDNKNNIINFILDIFIFTTFVIHFYIFNNNINVILLIFNILIQNLIHIDFFQDFINHLYLVIFIIHKTYSILTFGIILNITYIKIHTHTEYSINNIEKSNTISYTIIDDCNNTVDISYNCIIISECYKTICEANLIGYVDTRKTSYPDVKTSEFFDTIGDTDISVYVGIITEELSKTICETECIDYLDAPRASNANTETSEFDKTIGKTKKTSNGIVDDIVRSRVEGAMWWSADHHIERGCENIPSLVAVHQTHPHIRGWLKTASS